MGGSLHRDPRGRAGGADRRAAHLCRAESGASRGPYRGDGPARGGRADHGHRVDQEPAGDHLRRRRLDPARAGVDTLEPVSLFISRSTQRLYVRRGFEARPPTQLDNVLLQRTAGPYIGSSPPIVSNTRAVREADGPAKFTRLWIPLVCRCASGSRPERRMTIVSVRFSWPDWNRDQRCWQIADMTPTGSGHSPASTARGQTSRPNEIARSRYASALIFIGPAIWSSGSSTRSSSAGASLKVSVFIRVPAC